MSTKIESNFVPKLLVFCCENSGYLAAEVAEEQGLKYPVGVQLINLPCSGNMDIMYFLKALENGADGVIIMACQKENCKFLRGNVRAAQRVDQAKKILREIKIDDERVGIYYVAANSGQKFMEIIQVMYDKLRELGPNPGKVIK